MDDQSAENKEANAPGGLTWVDFVRVAASFLVVLAHVSDLGNGPSGSNALFYSLSRNGVPLFFMLSGFLLLPKQEDIWTFFKKRAARIVIPFVFWSIAYDVVWDHAFASSGVTPGAIFSLFVRILRGPRAAHLWFFYSLIGLYFFTPILRPFVAKARKSEIWYYILMWVLVTPVLYIVLEFTPVQNGFELQYFTGYVGYFLLGMMLGQMELSPRRMWVSLAVFAAGLAFTFAVFFFNLPPEKNELVFRSYPSLNFVIMSSAAFLLVKFAGERLDARHTGWIKMLSQASFGIYLIHPMILWLAEMVWKNLGRGMAAMSSLLIIPLATLLLYLASFAAAHLIRHIPVLKYIV